MIVYGAGEKKREVNQTRKLKCPNCEKSSIGIHYFNKYAHVFWIPTFPYGKRVVAHCDECDTAYEDGRIPDVLKNDVEEIKSTIRPPIFLFSGLFILIIGIFALVYISNGPKTYDYPSGEKQSRGKMVNNEMDGEWNFWYENGQISANQFYIIGKEDSIWTWWNEDGSINQTGVYKNGLSHGKWTFNYPSGQVQAEENYVNDRLQGQAKYWFENGKISVEGEYFRGYSQGPWKYYFESGSIKKEGSYNKDQIIGDWYSYYENGQNEMNRRGTDSLIYFMDYWDSAGIQLVKNGNGVYTSYYDNHNKASKGNYVNGLALGKWTYWFASGKVDEIGNYKNTIYYVIDSWDRKGNLLVDQGNGYEKDQYDNEVISSEGKYKDGLKEGEWINRNIDGIITSKTTYVSGVENGLLINYFETGENHSEGELLNNERNNMWVWYHQNGQVKCKINFVNGKKQGEQIFWNQAGNMVKKETYDNGVLIVEEVYN